MLPILISVSVAPVSYFFCASAPLLVTASMRRQPKGSQSQLIERHLISLITV